MAEGEVAYGDIYQWGWTDKGGPIPEPHKIDTIASINNNNIKGEIIQVEEIGETYLVLTDRGGLYTCGYNKKGLLGLKKDEAYKSDSLEEVDVGDMVDQFSVGRAHVLLKTRKGWVFAWGANEYGQVGKVESKEPALDAEVPEVGLAGLAPVEQKKEEKPKFVDAPMRVEGIDKIKMVVALEDSSYALTDEGAVFSWGRPKHIGRPCTELGQDEEGKDANEKAHNVPARVMIRDASTREDLKVRCLEKKRRKLIAYTDQPRHEDYQAQSEFAAEEPEEDTGKEKSQEQQAQDYKTLITCIANSKKEIMDKLLSFDDSLKKKATECIYFTENPFGGILRMEQEPAQSKETSRSKPVHIDYKTSIRTLCELSSTLKSHIDNNVSESDAPGAVSQDPEMKNALMHFYSIVEDSIKLRKLILLAFKMHSYHLRLKCHNILSSVHHLSKSHGNLSDLLQKLRDPLGDCTYISKRFQDLQGEFNKVYDEKADTLVSRTAFHLLDTTYTECEAWKYVNLMTHYAVIFQAGHEDLLSLNDKIGKMGKLYLELKKAEPHHVYALHQKAAEAEDQSEIMANVRKLTTQINASIVASKEELCAAGHASDNIHKNILSQVYEILIDSSMLRLAYYDLFLSFYESLKVKPVP